MWVGFHVSQEVKVPVFLQGASWGGGGRVIQVSLNLSH